VDVVGLGQISLDRLVRLAAWPEPGGRLALSEPVQEAPGGQIATAVLTTTRFGLRARLLGSVGDDDAAERALAPLRAAGVDVTGVRRVAGVATRSALVLVDVRDGERSVIGHRDPRLALPPDTLSRASLRGAGALLVDADDPDAARWAVGVAREEGIPCVLDVDTPDPERIALAKSVDFPIVSGEFSAQLSGRGREDETLARIAGPPVRMAVVTRGAAGAVARLGDERIVQPALRVAVHDSTGAGDVFRGAFVVGVLRGDDARRTLVRAATAAALACRGAGAQGDLPEAAEVEARMEKGEG
jgi:sugar/nucleoside kinase (ribokinase family)